MAHHQHDERTRTLIAQEAARIIVEEGVADFLGAKRKAAARLGISSTRNMPRNTEIEQAVIERQRLFVSDARLARLRTLREAALQAMVLFETFNPRLVGSVLSGTAHVSSDVNLHVFAEAPEELSFFMLDRNIPYRQTDKRVRVDEGYAVYPAMRFLAGDVEVEVVVFPQKGIRQAPLSTVDARPMRRANLEQVRRLLDEPS